MTAIENLEEEIIDRRGGGGSSQRQKVERGSGVWATKSRARLDMENFQWVPQIL